MVVLEAAVQMQHITNYLVKVPVILMVPVILTKCFPRLVKMCIEIPLKMKIVKVPVILTKSFPTLVKMLMEGNDGME